MDTLTHIVLGACIGDALVGKKLGKRALFLGAVAQSLPDIDFVAAFWMDPASNLLAHRGFTHSFLFGLLIAFFLAVASEYWHRKHDIPLKRWFLFFSVEIGVHLFIDAFNTYGIGWFEPFSHYRVAFNTIFVADPFFSFWPFFAFLALLWLKAGDRRRSIWWATSIAWCSLYLGYGVYNKSNIDHDVKSILHQKQVSYTQYLSTPTPLNNWLWYIAAGDANGFYIGYRSVFDRKQDMELHYFPRNTFLLDSVTDHETLQHLIRFSKGYYTITQRNDTLVFSDLRFQQVRGWYNPKEKFAFYYYIQHPADNNLVVQRGRFEGWNKETIHMLLKRIAAR